MGVIIDIPFGSPFTIRNIPFGVLSTKANPTPRCATAIGGYAIDLGVYSQMGHLSKLSLHTPIFEIFNQVGSIPSTDPKIECVMLTPPKPTLNAFAALSHSVRLDVRNTIIQDIEASQIEEECLIPLDLVTMHLPMHIGGYSDFYCSLEHCQNVSDIFFSDGTQSNLGLLQCSPMAVGSSIPKNWFYSPSVYNSRVSSIIPSPHPVRRPWGVHIGDSDSPTYGPSQEVDYELEMGYFVSKPVDFGSELDIAEADNHIFGFVLLNDWSSRDIHVFEMKPLGPFHGKGSE
jgi:fumarylacetoacetase